MIGRHVEPPDGSPVPRPTSPQAHFDLAAALRDRRRYRRSIERLFDQAFLSGRGGDLRQDGVSLAAVFDRRRRFSRLLARTVGSGSYDFAPGRIREIKVDGKRRDVFSFRMTDLFLHGVVAEIIDEASTSFRSPALYSYRRGVSWWHAASRFAAYVRGHRASLDDPRERGLYVLRRDVDAYTDSIPVGARSPLWPMLRECFGAGERAVRPEDWRTLESVIRPVVRDKRGRLVSLTRGVPTGQPVSCVLFNFYLHGLDRRLAEVSGGFYARYSDDILFAHPDPEEARRAAGVIEDALAGLDLKLKPSKSRDFFLTGAGRPSVRWPEARGTPRIPFLGLEIWADGTTSVDREKARELVRDLSRRARRTGLALKDEDLETRGRAVSAVLNRALDAETRLFELPAASLLRRLVTRRPQLRELDYLLARVVVRAVTGERGVKGFRRVSYRTVRRVWGLRSLFHSRNTRPGRKP